MTLQEFQDRLADKSDRISVENFDIIQKVYMYHPSIDTKDEIVKAYELGGMILIKDMLPRAEKIEELERKIQSVRGTLADLEHELNKAKV